MTDKSFTILVVEDNPGDQLLLKESLAQTGIDCKLIFASSSQESVSMIYTHHPNLIIMDINLPGLNGEEYVALLNGSSFRTRFIPVIFLTGEEFSLDQIDPVSQELIVADKKYILLRKPPNPNELKRSIARYMATT